MVMLAGECNILVCDFHVSVLPRSSLFLRFTLHNCTDPFAVLSCSRWTARVNGNVESRLYPVRLFRCIVKISCHCYSVRFYLFFSAFLVFPSVFCFLLSQAVTPSCPTFHSESIILVMFGPVRLYAGNLPSCSEQAGIFRQIYARPILRTRVCVNKV